MANGYVQIPPDSTGKKIDAVSLDVGSDSVIRQRIVLADNSATAQFATITAGALLVTGTVNISGTPSVVVTGTTLVNMTGTALCSIVASVPIAISGTATVVVGQGSNNIGGVSLVAGTANIGFINNISATVNVAFASPPTINNISATINNINCGFTEKTTNSIVQVADSLNAALRVNVVAGAASGVSQVDDTSFSVGAAPFVPVGGIFNDSGTGLSLSASHGGAFRMTGFRAQHVNMRTDGGVAMEDSTNSALRVNIVAGSASGVSQVDDTTFSARAAPFAPMGGYFADSGTGMSLSASHAGVLRMTGFRGLHVNLRDSLGNEISAGNALSVKVERISATPSVVLAAGTAVFGTLNNISATVNVVVGSGTNNIGGVSLVAGTSNIGFINNISATVSTLVTNFAAGSGQVVNPVDSVNSALRVNVVAGNSAGVSQTDNTSFTAQVSPFAPMGGMFDDVAPDTLAENKAGVARMTSFRALHTNLRSNGGSEMGTNSNPLFVNLCAFTDNSGNAKQLIDSANAALRVYGAGTLGSFSIGNFIDAGGNSRNLIDSVNLALRVTLANATATAVVAYASPPTINGISATVTVTTANPWIVNVPSASHGPKMVQISTSTTATLIVAPGAGLHTYITSLQVSNAGTVLTSAQIGWSGSPQLIVMVAAANGGGFVMNFDPPWKCNSNETVTCRVKPNTSGNTYFNVNFFVST